MRALIVFAALCLACYGAPVEKKTEVTGMLKSLEEAAETLEKELNREVEYKVEQKLSQAKAFGPEAVKCVSGKVEEFKKAVEKSINESGLAVCGPILKYAIQYVEDTDISEEQLDDIINGYENFSTNEFQKVLTAANTGATVAGLGFAREAYECMHK